jgi:hypothetical protein
MLNRHPHLHLWLWTVARGSHPPWHPVPRDLSPEGNTHNVYLRDYNSEQHNGRSDLELELLPVRSPLLRESLLVSLPPLNDMLKFGGWRRLI